jgi:hypothetical protein
MDLTFPSKHTDFQIGLKSKIQQSLSTRNTLHKQRCTKTFFLWKFGNWKQAGVAIVISYKADFMQKSVRRDKEVHYILTKGTIQHEDITILRMCAPNIGASTFITWTLLSSKDQTGPGIIIVRNLNTPFTSIDRTFRQENEQRYLRTKQYHGHNELHRHLQGISSYDNRVYIFLSSLWNFFQNRPHPTS